MPTARPLLKYGRLKTDRP